MTHFLVSDPIVMTNHTRLENLGSIWNISIADRPGKGLKISFYRNWSLYLYLTWAWEISVKLDCRTHMLLIENLIQLKYDWKETPLTFTENLSHANQAEYDISDKATRYSYNHLTDSVSHRTKKRMTERSGPSLETMWLFSFRVILMLQI